MDDTSKMDTRSAKRTSLSCPACGGALWKMPDPALGRYRCHIGHAFTEASLLDGQTEAIEQALVVALRTMEDRIKVLERVAREDRKAGWLDGSEIREAGGGAEAARSAAPGAHLRRAAYGRPSCTFFMEALRGRERALCSEKE